MKILLGKMFRMGESTLAIEIQGLGIFEGKDDEEEKPFKVIKLKKKDLLKLKVLIEKELHNEKKSNLE